jgi:hypothetical protein
MTIPRVGLLALAAAFALSTSANAAPASAAPKTPSKISVGEGFVDGERLVVAVETGKALDDEGVVMAIDLKTGERSVLSGKMDDGVKGPVMIGNGPDIGGIRAVTQAGSSWLALVGPGATSPLSIIRIDPKTGVRTLERKIDGPLECTGSKAKLVVDLAGGIAGGPDGTAYLAVKSGARTSGVVAVKGFTCSVVTLSGARGTAGTAQGVTWSTRVWPQTEEPLLVEAKPSKPSKTSRASK